MEFLVPHKIIKHFNIFPGMKVAELHQGSGFFTPLLKDAVGQYGNVHSFQYTNKRQIEVPEMVDLVVLINLPQRDKEIFDTSYRLLNTNGRMIFIDLKIDDIPEKITHLAGLSGFTRKNHFNAGSYHFGIVFKKR